MYYDSFSAPDRGLPAELFAPLFSAGPESLYKKGQLIYFQGQEPEFLYCLRAGEVRTSILSQQGEEKLLTVYRSGSIFGEASFFDGMPRVSTATAQTDCKIIRLGRGTVEATFRQHPELATAMIGYLARTVRLLSGHVDTMSFQQADRRLSDLLLHYPAQGDTLQVTQDALAAALNVSRVTVSRILSQFSQAGLLKTGYGTVTLLDREGLSSLFATAHSSRTRKGGNKRR